MTAAVEVRLDRSNGKLRHIHRKQRRLVTYRHFERGKTGCR